MKTTLEKELERITGVTAPIKFEPDGIFYDGPSGKYLVDAGAYFRTYGKKSPVMTGTQRHFELLGMSPKEAALEARDAIMNAEIDNHVEWFGNLAGHRKGMIHSADGKPMLVLTSPALPIPAPGPAPIISSLIRQAFPDQVQRDIFTGWLAGGYKAVVAGVHCPAPMLCISGPVNAGKSLVGLIAKLVLGGRSANPHTAWTGSLPWNDNLCAAELLLLDDCQGSTDLKSRINFGTAFKGAVYSVDYDMQKRHCSSMSVRPVWRVMVCCNDNAESLQILPPINSDTNDKVILLRIEPIKPPVDTSTAEGKLELRLMIQAELPQFARYLSAFIVPPELRDSRSGVLAWRHPDLVHAIESTKAETRLEELIESAFRMTHLWSDLPATLTAAEIESRLIDRDSPVRDQIKALFYWPGAAGTFLGRLADGGSEIVQPGGSDGHRKCRRFIVRNL